MVEDVKGFYYFIFHKNQIGPIWWKYRNAFVTQYCAVCSVLFAEQPTEIRSGQLLSILVCELLSCRAGWQCNQIIVPELARHNMADSRESEG